jgi:hypothetical protein
MSETGATEDGFEKVQLLTTELSDTDTGMSSVNNNTSRRRQRKADLRISIPP